MVFRRIRVIPAFVLFTLVLISFQISCVKLSGPGIMPPVNDNDYGQWELLSKDQFRVEDSSGQALWQWKIVARYVPDRDNAGLATLDITVTMDGVPVPFTFDPHTQVLESTTPAQPVSTTHRFKIMPSRERSQPFPTLTLDLEKR